MSSPGRFLGVGEVEEKFAARALDGGAGFVMERFPDLGHVRDHGPVHKGDEIGAGEMLEETVAAEAFADIIPGDLGERSAFDEHHFAVEKFCGVGVAGFGDGVDFSAFGERFENGMQMRVTERADVGDPRAEGREGVGHDGTVTAELDALGNHFDVGAATGGPRDAFGEAGDGGEAGVFLGVFALVDGVDDLVDKSIQADKGRKTPSSSDQRSELAGAVLPQIRSLHRSLIHFHADDIEHAFEVVVVEETDFHRSFALTITEKNLGAKPLLEAGLEGADVDVRCVGRFGGEGTILCGRNDLLVSPCDELFGFADAQAVANDFLRCDFLGISVSDSENRSRMTKGEEAVADVILDVGMELEEAKEIRDGGAVLADFSGGFLLRQGKIFDELAVAEGLFDGIEIFALKVFDEREFEDFSVVRFADQDRQFSETRKLSRSPAALAGDEFVFAISAADYGRLENALLADRVGQFFDRFLGEIFARLERAGGQFAQQERAAPARQQVWRESSRS